MQLRSWPFLPAGKSTITPLILGSICLIAAERIPAFHSTVVRLAASDLGGSILDAAPGLSWAKDSEREKRLEAGGSERGADEPDLDLELGIGPGECLLWDRRAQAALKSAFSRGDLGAATLCLLLVLAQVGYHCSRWFRMVSWTFEGESSFL